MAHEHSVTDVDKHFSIDSVTREITNESGKVVLMQHDHNSERFTFELPKTIEGHDMSKCNQVEIHYQNKEIATDTDFEDVYPVSDFGVSENNPAKFIFSWLISGNATQYVGALNFSIRFACVADDGTIEYAWNTAKHYGIIVSSSFYNSEAVVAAYSDVLTQWYKDLYLASVGEGVTVGEVRNMLGAVAVKTATITLMPNTTYQGITIENWKNGINTVNVAGVTADSSNCHVFATYSPGSYDAYRDSEIRLVSQGDGTLTFACDPDVVPTTSINVNVAIYYGEG